MTARLSIVSSKGTKQFSCETGQTVLSALRKAHILLFSPCGGNGTCGHCRVTVSGTVGAPTPNEKRILTKEETERGIRLACSCIIEGDCTVYLPDENMEVSAQGHSFAGSGKGETGTGVAVDIGTTTVALFLYDLASGKLLASDGFPNPQALYGADVISRMQAISENSAALADQQKLLTDAIVKSVLSFHPHPEQIKKAVFCGNTVMEHIAAGISPVPIATAPFTAPTLFGTAIKASSLGLPFADEARVYMAPCFASYVGGDILCGALAASLDKKTGNILFLDIGTNGETALLADGRLLLCATAAGPAFEGAGISQGMPGLPGAVCRVSIEKNTIVYNTIKSVPAKGICGSGLVDAVACMADLGVIDETGRMESPFAVSDSGVFITPADIRALQLAKAAVAAGIKTLLHTAGLSAGQVDAVYLAGGFGSFMNPKSVCRIGLIPSELQDRITVLGNTAGQGACEMLMEPDAAARADRLLKKAEYIELSANAFFMDAYVEEMMFPEGQDD